MNDREKRRSKSSILVLLDRSFNYPHHNAISSENIESDFHESTSSRSRFARNYRPDQAQDIFTWRWLAFFGRCFSSNCPLSSHLFSICFSISLGLSANAHKLLSPSGEVLRDDATLGQAHVSEGSILVSETAHSLMNWLSFSRSLTNTT